MGVGSSFVKMETLLIILMKAIKTKALRTIWDVQHIKLGKEEEENSPLYNALHFWPCINEYRVFHLKKKSKKNINEY